MNIRQTSGGAPSGIGEPSFADAIGAIGTSAELDMVTKRHWATSLRMFAQYLDLPLECIPARMLAIQHRVSKLHPAQLRINPKTFANHRANAKAALNWFGRVAHGSARKAPMGTEYRAFLAKIANRHARDLLSPFFRYLSGMGVDLSAVTDAHVDAYLRFRNDTGFKPFKPTAQRQLVRAWNAAATSVSAWPNVILVEVPRAAAHTGPDWAAFPPRLREDIDSYCARLGKPHKAANGRRSRAYRPATVAKIRRELIAAVRTAVATGIPLSELTSLAALIRPDRATAILDHYWQKNGENPSTYTINLAILFLSIARTFQVEATAVESLDDIRHQLEQYRFSGLTEKISKYLQDAAGLAPRGPDADRLHV